MNVISRLIHFYSKGTEGEVYHDVVGQILRNLSKLDGLTIYEMAELCYASTTTLSRLSKKLGFKSFSEFKTALASNVRGYSSLNRSMPYVPTQDTQATLQLYTKTVQDLLAQCATILDPAYLDQLVEAMARFKKVIFLNNFPLKPDVLQQDLLMSGKITYDVSNIVRSMEVAEQMDADCLVVTVVPKLTESVELIDLLKKVLSSGASTLVVSAAIQTQYDKYATWLLSFNGTATSADQYAFNYIMNILAMIYRSRYVD